MTPIKSNLNKENCSPQSSNCVIWQGPDLSCINLCKGDSVSEVVYKLAVELCKIKEATDMTDVDFTCLLNACSNTQTPEKTIAGIIQLIIDSVCCSITALSSAASSLSSTSAVSEEPVLVLPSCLQYVDISTGLPVTTLPLSEYAVNTANALCALRETVSIHQSQINNLEVRVSTLESDPGYVAPLVTPNCTYGSVVAGVPAEMDVLLQNLDQKICDLTTVLGSTTNIATAASSQCAFLSNQPALSQTGIMSNLFGWNNVISNMAQSMQNLWLTVCDMRAAMYDLKNCCGAADCSAFFLVYTANTDLARNNVTLIFNAGTVIPSGFTNCPLLSTVTITDGIGNTYTNSIDLVSLSTNPLGITFDVSTSSLNTAMPYTVIVDGCIVKNNSSCTKTVTTIIAAPTTTSTTTTTTTAAPCTCYNWTISPETTDLSAATGNTNSSLNNKIFADYLPCDSSTVVTVPFTTSANDQILGCSCNIPNAYYYVSNVPVPCQPGTLTLNGPCPLP